MPDESIFRIQSVSIVGRITSGQTMSDRLGAVESGFDKLSSDVATAINQQTDTINAVSANLSESISDLRNDIQFFDYSIDTDKNLFFDFYARDKIPASADGNLANKIGYSCIKVDIASLNGKYAKIRCNYECYRISIWVNGAYSTYGQWKYAYPSAQVDGADYIIMAFNDATTDYSKLMLIASNDSGSHRDNVLIDADYVAPKYILRDTIDLRDKTNEINDRIDNFHFGVDEDDFAEMYKDNVTVESGTNVKVVSFEATATTVHSVKQFPIKPYQIINLEFNGLSSNPAYSSGYTNGGAFAIEFLDANGTKIGTKLDAYVLGKNKRGFHRYQAIAPIGAKLLQIRIFTRGNTRIEISNFSLKLVDSIAPNRIDGVRYDSHLGVSLIAPRNTMSAFELSKKMGFKTLIFNIKRTSDGELVAIHNDTIDETSNGTGSVHDYTYQQLLAYDFGSWMHSSYTGEKIPKVDDVLRFCAVSGIRPIVSMHGNWTNTFRTEVLTELKGLCDKYRIRNIVLKGTGRDIVDSARVVFGNNATYSLGVTELTDTSISFAENFANEIYIELTAWSSTAAKFNECAEKGIVLGAFTNDYSLIHELIEKGVTIFTVDHCCDAVFPVR